MTSKIHAIVDAAGKATALSLMPGQRADIKEADPLLDEVDPAVFIADKAYDADPLIKKIEEQQIVTVIPSRKNQRDPRKISFHLYKTETSLDASCQAEAVQGHSDTLQQAEVNIPRSRITRSRHHRN